MNWFTSLSERIENAAKVHATRRAEAEYHRLLAAYYLHERDKVDPYDSPDAAYRYAYLFDKQIEQEEEEKRIHQLADDAKAKLDALCASSR